MAGADKYHLMEKLKELGWQESGAEDDDWCLVPPRALFERAPRTYHVYDAADLQDLLGEPVPKD